MRRIHFGRAWRLSLSTVVLCVVVVGTSAVTDETCQGELVESERIDEKPVHYIVESDLLIAMQDLSDPIGPAETNQDPANEMNEPPPAVPNLSLAPESRVQIPIPVPPVTTVNIVVNYDHNGEVERLESGAEEVAYRVMFPNLTRDFRLNFPNERVFVVDQVWVLSETLDIEDFNHRVDAVINDTGGLVITVRAFSKPSDSRLANRGTADFDHYVCLAARLGDLSFRVLLK